MIVRGTVFSFKLAFVFTLLASLSLHTNALAAQKVFSGAADGSVWETSGNWFPTGAPGEDDAASMNNDGLDVVVSEDFAIKSLTVGGKGNVSCSIDSYVYGTLAPETTSTDALYVRKNGTLVLQGAGTIVLRGPLHISEEAITTENSVMLWLQ